IFFSQNLKDTVKKGFIAPTNISTQTVEEKQVERFKDVIHSTKVPQVLKNRGVRNKRTFKEVLSIRGNILDKKIVEKILISIPYKYDAINKENVENSISFSKNNQHKHKHIHIDTYIHTYKHIHTNTRTQTHPPLMKLKETSTWIVVALITRQKIRACPRILITSPKSKFDWKMAPWWSHKIQSGKHIKVLIIDYGKEYNSDKFGRFCEDEGLEKKLTAKAVYTTVYILNRCPIKTLQDKTLIESWSGQKPSTKNLRVFGSIYCIHVDEDANWNWEEEKVVKNNILVPMQQPKEEVEEVTRDPSMLPPSPEQ
ncbi:hypothetical protein CR513_53003, partial [Mucuna pruriens]